MTNTERQHAYRDAINEYNYQAIGQPDPIELSLGQGLPQLPI